MTSIVKRLGSLGAIRFAALIGFASAVFATSASADLIDDPLHHQRLLRPLGHLIADEDVPQELFL